MRPTARRSHVARSRRAAVLASAVLVAIHGCADQSVYLAVPDAVFPTSGGGAGAPAEVLGEAGGAAGANDGLGSGGGRTRGGDGATTGPVVGSPVDPGAAGAGQAGEAGQAGAGGA